VVQPMVPNLSPPLDHPHRHSTVDELVAATEFTWCNVPPVQDINEYEYCIKSLQSEGDTRRNGADQIQSREPRSDHAMR